MKKEEILKAINEVMALTTRKGNNEARLFKAIQGMKKYDFLDNAVTVTLKIDICLMDEEESSGYVVFTVLRVDDIREAYLYFESKEGERWYIVREEGRGNGWKFED